MIGWFLFGVVLGHFFTGYFGITVYRGWVNNKFSMLVAQIGGSSGTKGGKVESTPQKKSVKKGK